MKAASNEPDSDPVQPASSGTKTWRVGTLVYTTPALVLLFVWLIGGDFLENMRERGMGPVILLMLKRFEASNFLVGLLVGSLPTAIGMILSPVISMMSDRHRGKYGRRIPFIAVPLPFAVVSMVGLAFAPTLGEIIHNALGPSSPGLNFWVLCLFVFFWSIYDIATVVAGAVFGGLVNDVVPPQVIGRFFGLFRASSLLAGILFNYFLMGKVEEYYFWLLIIMTALFAIGYGVICWKVKEGEYPPPEEIPAGGRFAFFSMAKTYVRECLTQPFYLLFYTARTFGNLAFGPFNAFSIFYAKSIGLDMGVYGKALALTYTISIVVTYAIGSLADRLHPLRLGVLFMAFYSVVILAAWFFAGGTTAFLWFFVAHGVISGAYMTGTASLQQRILPRDRFAQFASAGGILGSLAFMIMQPAAGLILDMFGQNYRLTFLMNGILSLLALALLVWFYHAWKRRGGAEHYAAP